MEHDQKMCSCVWPLKKKAQIAARHILQGSLELEAYIDVPNTEQESAIVRGCVLWVMWPYNYGMRRMVSIFSFHPAPTVLATCHSCRIERL